ncbi:slipin family protein [Asticcacaulis sp. BYS171W]|uniref:Slipin family protein n=1 Tax=Asticcacaulis aquaticus TaxID=2984212 RepID=A0ABT5HSC2_9CAUL|nr:slipin family protein [Asticcacaulis aquaticus]MDC7682966.1 slipin family protein [Asticcacaulis aquaticus]
MDIDPPAIITFIILMAVLIGALWLNSRYQRMTIYAYQCGLLYEKGVFVKRLEAGIHTWHPRTQFIEIVDTRKRLIVLPGQDILTRDNVNIRLTLAGFYQISDAYTATTAHESFHASLHNLAQIELRRAVADLTLEDLLAQKGELDERLTTVLAPHGTALGLTLSDFAVRDVLLPPHLKRAFAGVLEAQKDAQRQIEQARGEQAVLRSLANSARLYSDNPMLLQARLIQALSKGGNTIAYSAEQGLALTPKKKK